MPNVKNLQINSCDLPAPYNETNNFTETHLTPTECGCFSSDVAVSGQATAGGAGTCGAAGLAYLAKTITGTSSLDRHCVVSLRLVDLKH